MFDEFDRLVGLIELGAAASTVRPDNQNALNGIETQKQLAELVCKHEGLLLELRKQILEQKPIVEQEALISVFSHIDPVKASPQIFLILLQICVESEGLRSSKIAQTLTRFVNHPRSKILAHPLVLDLLRGNLEYNLPPHPPMRFSYHISYSVSDSMKESIQHGILIGLWDLIDPSDELKELVKELAKRTRNKSRGRHELVRGRAIELLGKWRLRTPEVINIVKQAQHDGQKASDRLLLEYSEAALKELR